MEDEIVIEDEEAVRLAELFAQEWNCTPEEAVYQVLLEKKERLQAVKLSRT